MGTTSIANLIDFFDHRPQTNFHAKQHNLRKFWYKVSSGIEKNHIQVKCRKHQCQEIRLRILRRKEERGRSTGNKHTIQLIALTTRKSEPRPRQILRFAQTSVHS